MTLLSMSDNYCKIRNNIIKTYVISFGRKYFLICIHVSKVLFLAFFFLKIDQIYKDINIYKDRNI